ncbi:hypothetical protein MPSEU_001043300 [Mayamaea pseudoterrestris]|nr:hypothetical protein MPSEU_001043300 [Mayamaea pseudoterrestris]
MAASAPTLEIDPASELEFVLSPNETTSTAILILRHAGGMGSMAFKVKTTQPRRYLVRPNQGLIAPGGSEEVQIMLVEKDKQALLQSFERLGQTALDHCKDKFLVQSCGVSNDFETEYNDACGKDAAMGYDKLSSMWATVTSETGAVVANKKLHVRHVAQGGSKTAGSSPALATPKEPSKPIDEMNQEELKLELQNLRRKYDELVAFSVNLTAERDLINNALEQTKREYDREVKKSAAQRNSFSLAGNHGGVGATAAAGYSTFMLCFIGFLMLVLGARYSNGLKMVPIFKKLLGASAVGVENTEGIADEL